MEYLVPCRGYRILVENLARGGFENDDEDGMLD